MERRPEPELMIEPAQVRAYAETDFSESDECFVRAIARHIPPVPGGCMIDLGCGPGNMCLRLALLRPMEEWIGMDGSVGMLEVAKKRGRTLANLRFVHAVMPTEAFSTTRFDGIVSNSLLHHLRDPQVLWAFIKERGKPGARVFIGDLRRPDHEGEIAHLTSLYLKDADPIVRDDFQASLRAAYREEEVEAQLERAGLDDFTVERFSDRHLVVRGIVPKRVH